MWGCVGTGLESSVRRTRAATTAATPAATAGVVDRAGTGWELRPHEDAGCGIRGGAALRLGGDRGRARPGALGRERACPGVRERARPRVRDHRPGLGRAGSPRVSEGFQRAGGTRGPCGGGGPPNGPLRGPVLLRAAPLAPRRRGNGDGRRSGSHRVRHRRAASLPPFPRSGSGCLSGSLSAARAGASETGRASGRNPKSLSGGPDGQ